DASLIDGLNKKTNKVLLSTTTGFSNIAKPTAYLTTNKEHIIKALPFQRDLESVSIYVETGRHEGIDYIFILPNQNIEAKKQELEQYVLDTCIKKESFYNGKSQGFDYFIPDA